MGKHSGKKAEEPGTKLGIPFSKMNSVQKAVEFDASAEDPIGYAQENFGQQNNSPEGKHKRG